MKFTWLFWIILAFGSISGVIFGIVWQADKVRHISPTFRSLAKIVVTLPDREEGAAVPDADFYGTCCETIESAEMRFRAMDRTRKVHPELVYQDVEIRTTRTQGSGILYILATKRGSVWR